MLFKYLYSQVFLLAHASITTPKHYTTRECDVINLYLFNYQNNTSQIYLQASFAKNEPLKNFCYTVVHFCVFKPGACLVAFVQEVGIDGQSQTPWHKRLTHLFSECIKGSGMATPD